MVAKFVTTRLHRTFQTGFEGKNLKSGLGGDIIKIVTVLSKGEVKISKLAVPLPY